MIPKKSISGTPEECADLMRQVMGNGIPLAFSLMPMGDVESVIRLLAERVLPRL
jgi:alkanesulfonate monooxygenase SsuD/methylene tetrahydromethanopterin reductase-like flavin-dependent oxidoreductase (luciferase family)